MDEMQRIAAEYASDKTLHLFMAGDPEAPRVREYVANALLDGMKKGFLMAAHMAQAHMNMEQEDYVDASCCEKRAFDELSLLSSSLTTIGSSK